MNAEKIPNVFDPAEFWDKCEPAPADHPYLIRKKVPGTGLRVDTNGRLVIPFLKHGEICYLQFISPNGRKSFLIGSIPYGGHFPIPAKDGQEDGPLLIGKGYATTMAACLSTGFAGQVAFMASNLPPVAQTARWLFTDRKIVILEDNDFEAARMYGKNPGQDAAEKAARVARAKIARCPALDGKNTDFNDLYCAQGPEKVRELIEQAQNPAPAPESQPESMRHASPEILPWTGPARVAAAMSRRARRARAEQRNNNQAGANK